MKTGKGQNSGMTSSKRGEREKKGMLEKDFASYFQNIKNKLLAPNIDYSYTFSIYIHLHLIVLSFQHGCR